MILEIDSNTYELIQGRITSIANPAIKSPFGDWIIELELLMTPEETTKFQNDSIRAETHNTLKLDREYEFKKVIISYINYSIAQFYPGVYIYLTLYARDIVSKIPEKDDYLE